MKKPGYLLKSMIFVVFLALLGRLFWHLKERFILIDHGHCIQRRVPVTFNVGDVRKGSLWLAPHGIASDRIYARVDGCSFDVTRTPEGYWEVQKDEDGIPIHRGL